MAATIHAVPRVRRGAAARALSRRCAAAPRCACTTSAADLIDEPDVIAEAPGEAGHRRRRARRLDGDPGPRPAPRGRPRRARPAAGRAHLDDKLAGPAGERRYTCPSWDLHRSAAGRSPRRASSPSRSTTRHREPGPELAAATTPTAVDVLRWAPVPLASAEIAAVMGVDRETAEIERERFADADGGFWSLAPRFDANPRAPSSSEDLSGSDPRLLGRLNLAVPQVRANGPFSGACPVLPPAPFTPLVTASSPQRARAHGPLRAGVATLDATYHVGASAGQYASTRDGGYGDFDPHFQQGKNQASYGVQSRLTSARSSSAGGRREGRARQDRPLHPAGHALAARRAAARGQGDRDRPQEPHDGRQPQPLVAVLLVDGVGRVGLPGRLRRALLRLHRAADRRRGRQGRRATSRCASAPAPAGWTSCTATRSARRRPTTARPPAIRTRTSSTRSPSCASTTSPAKKDKPLAVLLNYSGHPEFLEGNDLISADFLGPLERMVDRETGATTIFTQNAVGTAEPENSTLPRPPRAARVHAPPVRPGRVRRAAALRRGARDVERDRRAAGRRRDARAVDDRRAGADERPLVPRPALAPVPGRLELPHRPDARGRPRRPGRRPARLQPRRRGEPASRPGRRRSGRGARRCRPNYCAPSYGALQETLGIHLQALRIGDIFFTICSCEQWKDQARNIQTRTDRVPDNEWLGRTGRSSARPRLAAVPPDVGAGPQRRDRLERPGVRRYRPRPSPPTPSRSRATTPTTTRPRTRSVRLRADRADRDVQRLQRLHRDVPRVPARRPLPQGADRLRPALERLPRDAAGAHGPELKGDDAAKAELDTEPLDQRRSPTRRTPTRRRRRSARPRAPASRPTTRRCPTTAATPRRSTSRRTSSASAPRTSAGAAGRTTSTTRGSSSSAARARAGSRAGDQSGEVVTTVKYPTQAEGAAHFSGGQVAVDRDVGGVRLAVARRPDGVAPGDAGRDLPLRRRGRRRDGWRVRARTSCRPSRSRSSRGMASPPTCALEGRPPGRAGSGPAASATA